MGDAHRMPPVLHVHLRVLVPRRGAGDRGRASPDIPHRDVYRMGHRVRVPAGPQAAEAGLPALGVPVRGLREHVLLRALAERRAVSERQLVGGHGSCHLVHHRHHDRLPGTVHHGGALARPRDLRQKGRDGRDAVLRGPKLRRDLGDDGGLRRLRRRRILHGLRCQRHHGRPHRRSDRRPHRHRLRLLVPRQEGPR